MLPGTFGNLELDVIPKFLAKVLANNEELTLKETKVSERVRETSRECLVCSWGGNRTKYKCCWFQHLKAFRKQFFSVFPSGFTSEEQRNEHLLYKRMRFAAYKFFASFLEGEDNEPSVSREYNAPLPPCIKLRLKYWFSSRDEVFRKYD